MEDSSSCLPPPARKCGSATPLLRQGTTGSEVVKEWCGCIYCVMETNNCSNITGGWMGTFTLMSLMRTIPVLKGLISMLSAPNVCAFTHTLVWATTKSPTQHSVFPTQRSVDKHASTKCPSDRNNFGNSYNYLTFNRQISLYTITQCTKTKEMCFKKDFFFETLSSCAAFFCLLGKI